MSLPARLPVVSGALALLLLLAGCPDDDLGQVFPDLEVSLDSMDFGRVPVLHVSILEREITNRGLARLTIEEVEIAGEDADFFFAGEIDDVIDVGAQRALPVSFQPAEERSYRAVLRIRSDDPEEPVVEIDLSGEGSTSAPSRWIPPRCTSVWWGKGSWRSRPSPCTRWAAPISSWRRWSSRKAPRPPTRRWALGPLPRSSRPVNR
ncbi:MAG: hypothetical protein ACOC0J_00210 [Myxococcota bacterium]